MTGVVFGITGVANASTAPFWGKRADRVGYRKILRLSLTGITLFTLPQALVTNVYQLLILRAGLGVFASGSHPHHQYDCPAFYRGKGPGRNLRNLSERSSGGKYGRPFNRRFFGCLSRVEGDFPDHRREFSILAAVWERRNRLGSLSDIPLPLLYN